MYKLILILLCSFLSFPCFAKWKKIIETKTFTDFIETGSVKKKKWYYLSLDFEKFYKKTKKRRKEFKTLFKIRL